MRVWLIRLTPLWIVLLAAAVWFTWGSFQASAFDKRLAELRAAGSIKTLEDLDPFEVPTDTRGREALLAAEKKRAGIEHHHREVRTDWETVGFDRDERDYEVPWTEEERENAERYFEALAPYMEMLEQAVSFDSIPGDPQSTATGGYAALSALIHAYGSLDHIVAVDRQRASGCAQLGLALASRFVPTSPSDVGLYYLVWRRAIDLVREALVAGPIPAAVRTAWQSQLRAAEASLLKARISEAERDLAERLATLQAWRRGEEPHAEKRAEAAKEGEFDASDFEGDIPLDEYLDRAPLGWPRPLSASWLARPLLHGQGLAWLARQVSFRPRAWTPDGMRAWVSAESGDSLTSSERRLSAGAEIELGVVAQLRLARIGIDPRTAHGAYADAPLDPHSNKPFVWQRVGDELYLHPPESAVLLKCLDLDDTPLRGPARANAIQDELDNHDLRWRVR